MFKTITIQRYTPDWDNQWPAGVNPIGYSALIEGEDNSGNRWIMWLDAEGRPEVYWPTRDETGAVVGNPIKLDRVPGQFSGVFTQLGVQDDADTWDENGPRDSQVVSTFPVWHPGGDDVDANGVYPPNTMRGLVFAVVPGEGTPADRMRKFLSTLLEGFGIPGTDDRIAKMRQILADPDPEFVVRRLKRALEAAEDPSEETKAAIQAIVDRKSTQEAKVIPSD